MARGYGRRYSASDSSQYGARSYGNAPFRGRHQLPHNDQHASLTELASSSVPVPLATRPVTRRGEVRPSLGRSETEAGNRARTYWHEDLQERRTVHFVNPRESASPEKERKRDIIRKKWKNVIQVIKDLGNHSHRRDADDERRERVRRSISAPM